MTRKVCSRRDAQLVVVALCAAALKLHYSTAAVDELRWVLAPTAFLVELAGGGQFEFEAHAGYMNTDRTFVIAAPCAGVNFLITAFLTLALRRLWGERARGAGWKFIPLTALCAYLTTLVANTARITTALQMRAPSPEVAWLSPTQLHRLEGIIIYFGFLLLLSMLDERAGSRGAPGGGSAYALLRKSFLPLLVYYATTLGLPAVNGASRGGAEFWEHSLFVLLTPLPLMLPLAAFRFYRDRRVRGRHDGRNPRLKTA